MSANVASVTTAHNAASTLPRQMEALLAQTHPLKEIIVVDNASKDGTSAMLAERYPQVTVLRMDENLGAAGAWAAGLAYAALEKGYDWVWTFDDDSIPEPTSLETLLKGLDGLGVGETMVGMAATSAVDRASGSPYRPMLWREGFVKGPAELLRQPVWLADLVIASGCMVRRLLVERIGLPRADFFMDIFDLEYCIRARSHGYKIAVVREAKLTHEIGSTREIRLPGYHRLWMTQPPWREYYICRNLVFLAWHLYPASKTKVSIANYIVVHFAGVLLFSPNKLACAVKMIQGFADGLLGRLGKRFGPGSPLLPNQINPPGAGKQVDARRQ